MKRVYSATLFHESNTFNPIRTDLDDFLRCDGEEGLSRMASTEHLRAEGIDVVGGMWAMALSSGPVRREVFEQLKETLLADLRRAESVDGVLLHLHGAMTLDNGQPADAALLMAVRRAVGKDVPIVVAMDPHANLAASIAPVVDGICAYRTIPHVDQGDTERRAARLLLRRMAQVGWVPPVVMKLPMIVGGDSAIDRDEPLKTILSRTRAMEGQSVFDASFFVGFAWADGPDMGSAVVVNPVDESTRDAAQKSASEVADFAWEHRDSFRYAEQALAMDEAISWVLVEEGPVVLADTGDNPTGGAPGTGTGVLRMLMQSTLPAQRKIMLGPIRHDSLVSRLWEVPLGTDVDVVVGDETAPFSEPVRLAGELRARGDLLGYLGSVTDAVGRCVMIRAENLDVVVADHPSSFVTMGHFAAAGLDPEHYDVVIVKQGYFFPEISEQWRRRRFILSPGATEQELWRLPYGPQARGLHPFARDASWS